MKKIFCQQTHSNNIEIINNSEERKVIPDCDGLITSSKNFRLCIRTADCLPITIKSTKIVAVVHAGWRGLKKNIVSKAIKLINKEFKVDSTDLKIKIGPSIDKENYLVKSDVYNIFKSKYSIFFEKVSDNQWKMDLKGICVDQILKMGVLKSDITLSKVSTFNNLKYPSFRRDGKTKGFITEVVLK